MTYANAVLPHALFVAARCWPEEDFLEVAEASFEFLDRVTAVEGVFWPVGSSDWYPHGEEKSLLDRNRSRPSPWPTPRWPDSRCGATPGR